MFDDVSEILDVFEECKALVNVSMLSLNADADIESISTVLYVAYKKLDKIINSLENKI